MTKLVQMLVDKELRTFIASAAFIFLVLALGGVLIYIEIPPANKDLIVSIISMLVGATGVAVGRLLGKEDGELEKLKHDLLVMQARHTLLKESYDSMVKLLVDRHIISQDGIKC